MLQRRGFTASAGGPGVEVLKRSSTPAEIVDVLVDAAVHEAPPLDMLLANAKNLQREKWDWALPDDLLRKAYASLYLDIEEAVAWLKSLPPPSGNAVPFAARDA